MPCSLVTAILSHMTRQVLIVLGTSDGFIRGQIEVPGEGVTPFSGWLDLLSGLHRAIQPVPNLHAEERSGVALDDRRGPRQKEKSDD